MKKVFMIALAILISVAFVTTVFAQAPKDAPKPPAVDKPAKAEKAEKPAKAKGKTFAGVVVKAEAAAFVAKDKKGEMTFDVSGVKGYKAENYAAGDKVVVKYAEKDGEMMASAIKKAKAPAKKEKKEMKKEDKPAATPATPATPPPAKK